ncbi:MAG: hypothetical protein JWQ04_3620, partial [Pedosphaera sp.]|nr:hypothetical protein [Pedosphaera sp.]
MTHTKKNGGLTKAATGIQGFDDITGGGVPQGRTTLVMGGPGSGKTVFALQSLVAGAREGEPGILVTFQESPRQLAENAASFGWDIAELEKDKLVILDSRIRPNAFKSIQLYLSGMLAGIRVVANEMGAKRIAFDGIDTLFSLLGDRMNERHEIFRLRDWLLESGLTSIITAQVDGHDLSVFQRHGFMQFMADCVVNLNHQLTGPEIGRSLRVVKYRGSSFVERELPLAIGPDGIRAGSSKRPKALAGIQQEITASQASFQARI